MRRLLVFLPFLTAMVGFPFVSSSAHSEEASLQVAIAANDATSAKEQPSGLVKGEVLKVDNDMSQIVIKHQKLTGLGMPAMTMVFSVPDRSLLEGVKQGEKIKFAAQVAPQGLLVTKLELESN